MLTMSGTELMLIFLEVSPSEKVTRPSTGVTSREGSALLLAVRFQVTSTVPNVPLSRKTSKLVVCELLLDSPATTMAEC